MNLCMRSAVDSKAHNLIKNPTSVTKTTSAKTMMSCAKIWIKTEDSASSFGVWITSILMSHTLMWWTKGLVSLFKKKRKNNSVMTKGIKIERPERMFFLMLLL